tara:strand:+ start:256 stop:495 length:240 start_codon:yes stop_codon:yes gene_type:complete
MVRVSFIQPDNYIREALILAFSYKSWITQLPTSLSLKVTTRSDSSFALKLKVISTRSTKVIDVCSAFVWARQMELALDV